MLIPKPFAIILVLFSSAALALPVTNHSVSSLDMYGGNAKVREPATGYFYAKKLTGGYWSLIDPIGHPFISIGVNGVKFNSHGDVEYNRHMREKFETKSVFLSRAVSLLKGWGFNTLGAWSDNEFGRKGPRMPYMVNLAFLAKSVPAKSWKKFVLPDVFSSRFKNSVSGIAKRAGKRYGSDPYLIGYFTDNEPRFTWVSRSSKHRVFALDQFIKDDNGNYFNGPGRLAAVKLLSKIYGNDFQKFSSVWKTNAKSFQDLISKRDLIFRAKNLKRATRDRNEFISAFMAKYYTVVMSALHKFDPHHMVFGVRFGSNPASLPAVKVSLEYSDALSFNVYSMSLKNGSMVTRLFNYACSAGTKPILISEFTFRAGSPGTHIAGNSLLPTVKTQNGRVTAYSDFVESLLTRRCVVGYHWFRWEDRNYSSYKHSRGQRFAGNVGLIGVDGRPWSTFTAGITRVNNSVYELRQATH